MENKKIYEFHAQYCKVFSSPQRLMILECLKAGELTNGDIVSKLGSAKANISQHLTLMKMMRIVKTRREGTRIYFRIANKKLVDACCMMQDALKQLMKGVPIR